MTLKEKILKESAMRKKNERTPDKKSELEYDLFLKICENVDKYIFDMNMNIECNTYEEVFNAIENYHIDISNIIKDGEYENFKQNMLSDRAQWCPHVGKNNDNLVFDEKYDSNFKEKHGGGVVHNKM